MDQPSTPDTLVDQFLTAHKYTFPVLRGSAYESEAGVPGTPTTFFVSPKGDLVFKKVGYSKHLVQEFNWRLEAMEKPVPPQVTARRHASAKPKKTE